MKSHVPVGAITSPLLKIIQISQILPALYPREVLICLVTQAGFGGSPDEDPPYGDGPPMWLGT